MKKGLTYTGLIINVFVFLFIFNNLSWILEHWFIGLIVVAIVGAIASAILDKR